MSSRLIYSRLRCGGFLDMQALRSVARAEEAASKAMFTLHSKRSAVRHGKRCLREGVCSGQCLPVSLETHWRVAAMGALSGLVCIAGTAACSGNGSSTSLLDGSVGDVGPAPPTGDGGFEAGIDATLDAPAADGGGGGDAPTETSVPGSDLGSMEAFCAAFAKATCDRQAYCAGAADGACVPNVLAQCHSFVRAQTIQAIDAGLVAFDPVRAASCFAAASFDEFCFTNDLFRLVDCQGIFAGTVAMGGACVRIYMFGDLDECATGVCSVGEQNGACGGGTCGPYLDAGATCVDDAGALIPPGCARDAQCFHGACAPVGQLGDPCVNPGELCRALWPQLACAPTPDGGLACDYARDAGGPCAAGGVDVDEVCRSEICVSGQCSGATADGGIACLSPDPPCPTGTACQGNGKTDPPSCQPPIPAGTACSAGSVCAAGTICDPDAGVCTPLPAAGAPCSGSCVSGFVCSLLADAGTCRAVVGDGGTCQGAGDDVCAPGLTCRSQSSTCAPLAGFGAACGADTDCDRGLYCNATTTACLTWKRNGEACARDGECVFGTGCTMGHCASGCAVP
jgi:hypothetical protein